MAEFSNEELAMISGLARKQVNLELALAELAEREQDLREQLKEVQEVALPNAMAEIQMSEFKLEDGTKITIKNDVHCSIPKEDENARQRAFNWLRDHDFGGLIKNEIICSFGKGQDADALEAAQLLAASGFNPEQKQNVHPSTLKAFVKEQMGKGTEIPLDYFGAFTTTKSKVELPKAK
jgi:hypothetical protein